MLRRETLRDQAAVILGAAKNLGAVALDDESDLQREPQCGERVGQSCLDALRREVLQARL